MLEILTRQLIENQSLSDAQAAAAVQALIASEIPTAVKADFLTALHRKGETAVEIAAFARALRDKAVRPPLDAETSSRQILDVCGTGGDKLSTFNISTTAALVAASAGITIAKHGNRAITSKAGSADVLEALGIKIDLEPEQAARALRDHGFAFLFAPKYHPAFKEIAPVRKLCAERGHRLIFNFLGPLLNPVRPAAQLIGVPRPQLCQPIAEVLQTLGAKRGMVVCGTVPVDGVPAYLDELSSVGENYIAEFYHERGFATSVLSHLDFPVQTAALADLVGGDREANAEIVRRLLRGEDRGPKRDTVLLTSAATLLLAEVVSSLSDGWEAAAELIDSGKALSKLNELAAAAHET